MVSRYKVDYLLFRGKVVIIIIIIINLVNFRHFTYIEVGISYILKFCL